MEDDVQIAKPCAEEAQVSNAEDSANDDEEAKASAESKERILAPTSLSPTPPVQHHHDNLDLPWFLDRRLQHDQSTQ